MEMTLLLTSKRIDKKLHLESQIVKLSKFLKSGDRPSDTD